VDNRRTEGIEASVQEPGVLAGDRLRCLCLLPADRPAGSAEKPHLLP